MNVVTSSICDVAGLSVGHFTETRRPTGCTVVLCEQGATAGVDVRGAAPGTRESDLLAPENTVDVVHALLATLDARPRGVFNVAGPQPVPLSVIIRETGRTNVPVPGPLLSAALGRFGLPRLPRGALEHIRYPITVDSSAFRKATSFQFTMDEKAVLRAYREAFPRPHS